MHQEFESECMPIILEHQFRGDYGETWESLSDTKKIDKKSAIS